MNNSSKYKFQLKKVAIGNLNNNKFYNPSKGRSAAELAVYCTEARHFGYFDKPVVYKEKNGTSYIVLSHLQEVETAKRNGLKEMEVMVAQGLLPGDDIRFSTHRSFFLDMTYVEKFNHLTRLQHHLTETESGKTWAEQVPGRKLKEKMATISGLGYTTIVRLMKMGKRDFRQLTLIDQKNSTFTHEYAKISSQKKKQRRTPEVTTNLSIEDCLRSHRIQSKYIRTQNGIAINSDCVGTEGLSLVKDKTVALIHCDLPYEILKLKKHPWDKKIPIELLWKHFLRILKPGGAVVLHSVQPFTSELISSNKEIFKYCYVWDKVSVSNHQNAQIMPLTQHEDICVFGVGVINYYPGATKIPESEQKYSGAKNSKTEKVGHIERVEDYVQKEKNFPRSILRFPRETDTDHPCQKPVDLYKYIIERYTTEGEIVLDACLGSGTTCVAASETNRNYIGFEKDSEFFKGIADRLNTSIINPSKTASVYDMNIKKAA